MDSDLEQTIRAIAEALNERFKHCKTIGRLKAIHGLPTLRKTVEDVVKERARIRFEGEPGKIDDVFDHILVHSRNLQDHVRAAFDEAGAKAGDAVSDNVDAEIEVHRKTVQQTDVALVEALNEFRALRAGNGDDGDCREAVERALLNTLDTPDDPRFDEELRLISERIAALS